VSRIDELIAELCPDGVPHLAVGDVGTFLSGLGGKTKADFSEGNARFVSYRNVYNNLAVDQTANDFVRVQDGEQQNELRLGDVLFTGSSETPDDVGMSSVVLEPPQEPLYLNSFCFCLRLADPSLLMPDYSKYIFRSARVRQEIAKTASGVTRFNISKGRFARITIPVPPREVQRETVRVLDAFTELEAELEAELEGRRRQYEYYRQLLVRQVRAETVELSTLGEWWGGMTPSKSNPGYWDSGDVPWLASLDVSDPSGNEIRGRVTALALKETSLRVVPAPSVAVVMRSNILRRRLPIGLVEVDTTLNQDMRALVPRDGVDARYVYQALRAASERIRSACVRTDGSMAAVDSRSFSSWQIPLPSLGEQRQIAAQLDKFDALVNDLSSGLPAELVARRKQYEYYRDRLLTFKEAVA
jgi:type I restriction enzyme S subunit